jgi:hypothetical protein
MRMQKEKATFFATPERKTSRNLKRDLETLINNPLVSEMLYLLSGVVMIINDKRQILTVNKAFLDMTGFDSPLELLGLRPGEALDCAHAAQAPGGCGTGEACASCGAAMAIVTCLCTDKPVERYCALKIEKGDRIKELFFRVTANPVHIPESGSLMLVSLQDVTTEHRWANLERIFYHDVNNLITAMLSISYLMNAESDEIRDAKYRSRFQEVCERLAQEVSIQQYLTNQRGKGVILNHRTVPLRDVLSELSAIYAHHPKAANRRLVLPRDSHLRILTDPGLLIRVLGNMVTNALEATPEGGEVVMSIRENNRETGFEVWNEAVIPPSVQPRIFQRHFSTKDGFERGLGTFAMKLLGEQILGGRVEFSSGPGQGTSFWLWLPGAPP